MQLIMDSQKRHFFVRASKHLDITPLAGKRAKSPKKSAILDHILLQGEDAIFENSTILLTQR